MVRSLLLLAAVVVGSACARHAGSPEPERLPVLVEVKNEYGLAMEVYIVSTGTRHRLGTVHPGTSAQFTVPPALIGNSSVELQAQPNASNKMARSGPLLVSPGAIVDFLITAQLFNSYAAIRQ